MENRHTQRADQPTGILGWLFRDFFRPSLLWMESSGTLIPPCDIDETDDVFGIFIDLPGIRAQDIHVERIGNGLRVYADRHSRRVPGLHHHRHTELTYGRLERNFTLPESVAASDIEACYENGVLHLSARKKLGMNSDYHEQRTIPVICRSGPTGSSQAA